MVPSTQYANLAASMPQVAVKLLQLSALLA